MVRGLSGRWSKRILTVGSLGATTRDNRVRSLGGEAFGDERCVRRRIRDIRRRRGSFFLDLSEQPHPCHIGHPLLLRMIVGETAGLEDDGTQLGDAPATGVVELHKRRPGRGIASCSSAIAGARGRRCLRLRRKRAPTRQRPPFPSS
jgi:hypothetical protein